jgi:hypothetical protein
VVPHSSCPATLTRTPASGLPALSTTLPRKIAMRSRENCLALVPFWIGSLPLNRNCADSQTVVAMVRSSGGASWHDLLVARQSRSSQSTKPSPSLSYPSAQSASAGTSLPGEAPCFPPSPQPETTESMRPKNEIHTERRRVIRKILGKKAFRDLSGGRL